MIARLRNYVERRWYSGSAGPLILLLPLSWLFGFLAAIRRGCFSLGLLRSPRLPVPVVVVGNVTVGGTGKTPVVAWLAGQLQAQGMQPGIVSRGYGAKPASLPRLVTRADAEMYGDEPVLLAQLAACPVCVSRDRVAAVRRLAAEGVNVVISDDGLQHYRMQREVEIVVVDGARGFGNGYLLPAGPLREPPSRAYAADVVLINGGSPNIAGYPFSLQQEDAVNLRTKERRSLESFSGVRVWAVAGIGNPDRFRASLEQVDIQVDPVEVPDHGQVSLADLLKRRDQPVLMTDKDAVKYSEFPSDRLWRIPVAVIMSSEKADALLTSVIKRLGQGES